MHEPLAPVVEDDYASAVEGHDHSLLGHEQLPCHHGVLCVVLRESGELAAARHEHGLGASAYLGVLDLVNERGGCQADPAVGEEVACVVGVPCLENPCSEARWIEAPSNPEEPYVKPDRIEAEDDPSGVQCVDDEVPAPRSLVWIVLAVAEEDCDGDKSFRVERHACHVVLVGMQPLGLDVERKNLVRGVSRAAVGA